MEGAHSTFIDSPGYIELNQGEASDDTVAVLQEAMKGQDTGYLIFSYATPVAVLTDAGMTVTEEKFSTTTSRLQNICREF